MLGFIASGIKYSTSRGAYLANTIDFFVLLGCLRPLRVWNGLTLIFSYFYSRITRKPKHWGMPISVAIEPTTSCNLRCPECPSGLRSFTRPTGMLDQNQYASLIDQLHKHSIYLTFYFQGEPYLHPDFVSMVRYAAQKGLYTSTSTNAHFMTDAMAKATVESGLSRLIISLDGTTQETYAQYRVGGKLQKVLEGTQKLLEWKRKLGSSTPFVVFQFLVVKPNEHQIMEAKTLAKRMGVNKIVFKTAQIYEYENGSDLIPSLPEYSRYKQEDDGTWSIKNKLLNHCWKMWHSCVITWDGRVVPCCFDKDAHHVMGHTTAQTFEEIWKGDAYKKFRTALLKSRKEIDMCKNCSEGGVVFA